VANCEWKIGAAARLRAARDPSEKPRPIVHHRPEIVKRPKRDLGDFDPIVMPVRTPDAA
jgi:hypothetical protein